MSNSSYGYEELGKKKRAQRRKKLSESNRRQREATVPEPKSRTREATGGKGTGAKALSLLLGRPLPETASRRQQQAQQPCEGLKSPLGPPSSRNSLAEAVWLHRRFGYTGGLVTQAVWLHGPFGYGGRLVVQLQAVWCDKDHLVTQTV